MGKAHCFAAPLKHETATLVNEFFNRQDLAAALLVAEVRLGELFKAMDTHRGRVPGKGSTSGTFSKKKKYKAIESLGFADPKKTAYRFELMAEHQDIVEQVTAEASAIFGAQRFIIDHFGQCFSVSPYISSDFTSQIIIII